MGVVLLVYGCGPAHVWVWSCSCMGVVLLMYGCGPTSVMAQHSTAHTQDALMWEGAGVGGAGMGLAFLGGFFLVYSSPHNLASICTRTSSK